MTTREKSSIPFGPPLEYDWQVYPMRWISNTWEFLTPTGYSLTVVVQVWRPDGNCMDMSVTYGDQANIPVDRDGFIQSAFRNAQERLLAGL